MDCNICNIVNVVIVGYFCSQECFPEISFPYSLNLKIEVIKKLCLGNKNINFMLRTVTIILKCKVYSKIFNED